MIKQLRAEIAVYLQGKTWYWYVPVWLFGFYIFFQLLDFDLSGQNAFIILIPQAFNFILHEMAHLFTAFLPSLITASAGSGSELFLGLALIIGAFYTRSFFASLFCFLWFMLATQSTADYMADARTQNLPLVSFGGGDPIHDWNYVFSRLGILEYDTLIAGLVRTSGIIVGIVGLLFSAWLLIKMASTKPVGALTDEEADALRSEALAKGLKAAPKEHFKALSKHELYPTPTSGRLAEPSEAPAKTIPKD